MPPRAAAAAAEPGAAPAPRVCLCVRVWPCKAPAGSGGQVGTRCAKGLRRRRGGRTDGRAGGRAGGRIAAPRCPSRAAGPAEAEARRRGGGGGGVCAHTRLPDTHTRTQATPQTHATHRAARTRRRPRSARAPGRGGGKRIPSDRSSGDPGVGAPFCRVPPSSPAQWGWDSEGATAGGGAPGKPDPEPPASGDPRETLGDPRGEGGGGRRRRAGRGGGWAREHFGGLQKRGGGQSGQLVSPAPPGPHLGETGSPSPPVSRSAARLSVVVQGFIF